MEWRNVRVSAPTKCARVEFSCLGSRISHRVCYCKGLSMTNAYKHDAALETIANKVENGGDRFSELSISP